MPTILRVGGNRYFFFSEEGQEPPHIHVRNAEKYAKFWLNPVQLFESFGYNSVELRRVQRIVEENRAYFIEQWNEHFTS